MRSSRARVPALLVFVLAACGGGKDTGQPTQPTPPAVVPIDALEIQPGSGQVALAGGQAQKFVVRARRGGSIVAWPGGTATWTLSSAAVTATTVDDSTVSVTAATLSANAAVTMTARLGTLSSTASLAVIAQAAAASMSIGATGTAMTGTATATATLDVAAFDVNGNKVVGVTPGTFTFAPVSTPFGVVTVTPAAVSAAPAPVSGAFSAIIMIDQSGSMTLSDPSLARMAAAKQFFQGLGATDEAALYTFTQKSTRALAFSSSPAALSAAADGIVFENGGATAMFDAGIDGCQYARTSGRNAVKAVILLTDGGDTGGNNSLGDLIANCASDGIRVFVVRFAARQLLEEVTLVTTSSVSRLAAVTGGTVTSSSSVDAILSAIRSVPAMLRGSSRADRLSVTLSLAGGAFPEAGEIVGSVSASTSGGVATTQYRLGWAPGAGTARLSTGSMLTGTVTNASQVDNYAFTTLVANEGYTAVATRYATGFEADLRVAPPASAPEVGGNRHDFLAFDVWLAGIIPSAGTSTLSVRAASGTRGGYELYFFKCVTHDVGLGTGTLAGTLGPSDCPYARRLYSQLVQLTGTAGQTLSANLTSPSFVPLLHLIDGAGRVLASALGASAGSSARISYTFPASARYILVVSQYEIATPGAFTLTTTQSSSANLRFETAATRALFERREGQPPRWRR